jgi:hypothetical protein
MTDFKIYVERPSKGDKGEPGQTIIINAEDPLFKEPPPKIFPTYTSTSTNIKVQWNFPTQTKYSFALLPFINKLHLQFDNEPPIVKNIGDYLIDDNFAFNTNGNYFFDKTLTTINITKLNGTDKFVNNNKEYKFYNRPKNSYELTIWYSNFMDIVNKNTITIKYITINQPSPPSNILLTTSNLLNAIPIYNVFTNNLTWNNSIAEVGVISELEIKNYTIKYTSLNTKRRNGVPVTRNITTNSTKTNIILQNLMPDTDYKIEIYATNTGDIDSDISIYNTTTTYLIPKITPTANIIFPNRYYSSQSTLISNQTIKTYLVNSNLDWESPTNFEWPIHDILTRGDSSGDILLNIYIDIYNGNVLNSSHNISFSGFNNLNIPTNNTNGNTVLSYIISDSYSAKDESYRGFYTHFTGFITLKNTNKIFEPSKNPYSIKIRDDDFVEISGSFDNNLFYYYDGEYIFPIFINTPSISINNSVIPIKITGIPVYDTLSLTIRTTVDNIGKYFYTSPILQYFIDGDGINSIINSTYENNLQNNINNTTESFEGPQLFINNNVNNLIPQNNIYLETVLCKIIVRNAKHSNFIYEPIKAIVDQRSIYLVNSILSTWPVPENRYLSTNYISGSRIISSRVYPTFNNIILFDNNKNLTFGNDENYNYELPIIGGKFKSANSYLDYSVTGKDIDGPNYSIIGAGDTTNNNSRYVTFAWKINNIFPNSTDRANYPKISFKFNDTSTNILLTNYTNAFISNQNYLTVSKNGVKYILDIHYKIISDTPNPDFNTYNWIYGSTTSTNYNGNLDFYTKANDNNYDKSTNLISDFTLSNNVITYELPKLITVGKDRNIFVLLRIGIPCESEFSFSYVSAKLNIQ